MIDSPPPTLGHCLVDIPDAFVGGRPVYRVRVIGDPVRQGDHAVNPKTGRLFQQGEAALKRWRRAIVDACDARRAMGLAPPSPITGPVWLETTILLPRPKSHHVAGDRDRPLRDDAPLYVSMGGAGRGDIDKFERGVFDAMSAAMKSQRGAAWYADDCQIADGRRRKLWAPPGTPPGALLAVMPLTLHPTRKAPR